MALTTDEIRRQLDEIQGKGQAISRNIQDLKLSEGDTGAQALAGSRLAQSAGESTPSMKFGQILMNMLIKAQQSVRPGIESLQTQQRGLQTEQAQRMATTPESLIGASPSLQSAARGASVSALEPSISGAGQRIKTLSQQLEMAGDVLSQARLLGQTIQQEEESKRKESIDLIFKYPSAVQNLSDTEKKELSKRSGISIDVINAMPIEQPEKWEQITLRDGSLAQQNTKTGQMQVLVKAEKPTTKADEATTYTEERKGRIINAAKDLMNRVSNWTVGGGVLLKSFPGSSARDFSADLDQLKSNIAFSELQEMRNASKTGGALGQVAVRELELLESTLGALDQGQSQENFRKNLEQVIESINNWYQAKGGISDEWEYIPD